MRKHILFIGVLLAVLSMAALTAYSQEDIEFVEDSGFVSNMRPLPAFMHDEHNKKAGIEECNECHHVYEDGQKLEDESSEDMQCADCHEATSSGSMPGLREAFHLNCKGCHMETKKGPVMCGQCHER